ncbi:uncharacterized protein JN550_000954 [Neoarthrinium moseri]|uniref:uncharacterized protein n=1 Tax=Neoarthrinium moseri TaxID=1658444 RepID=UPI001FDC822D|nr:uncharacterized protein JN550_000954 [Neoarthrinium moseri]KAI1876882.1 hypothetical protein JN550_000954 [Neoarthrinium moseri]
MTVSSAVEPPTAADSQQLAGTDSTSNKGVQFWLVFLGLCFAGFVAATDSTIIFTALPTIANDFGGQSQYVWLGNAYVFASTAIQPLYGQVSNIFGRRYPMLMSVALFALGSGIAGGANSTAMFISGRLVQGLGAGGMIMLIDLIVCDLLPLRERSTYLGTVLGACAVGSVLGPVIGGAIVTRSTWRWAFWINLPVCALTLAVMVPFLRISSRRSPSWVHSVSRIDYLGNTVFVGSITSILIGLVQGGVVYPWKSWQTILPIVLGFSQLSASALTSGLNILPINAFMIPSGAVAGAILTKTGRYKPLHWAGFGVLAISCGLFSTMSSSTSTIAWAWFEILAGIGIGLPLTTQLPAVQAVLSESDTAISTSTYSFVRSFGFVWGATIPSIVFNSRVDAMLGSITDTKVRAALAGGGAYSYALSVKDITDQTLQQTLEVYREAMRVVWFVGLAFALVGFLLVFAEKHVEMRVTLETEFGLKQAKPAEKQITNKSKEGA